jgi:hypothetical protein
MSRLRRIPVPTEIHGRRRRAFRKKKFMQPQVVLLQIRVEAGCLGAQRSAQIPAFAV